MQSNISVTVDDGSGEESVSDQNLKKLKMKPFQVSKGNKICFILFLFNFYCNIM